MSDTTPAPAPAPVSRVGRKRWLLGVVLGTLAATAAFFVARDRLVAESAYKAEVLIALPPNEETKLERRILQLRSRELRARALADPEVAQLPSVRNSVDPGADIGLRLAVEGVGPDALAVTLYGNNPDDMKVIVKHLAERFIDDEHVEARCEHDAEKKRLEPRAKELRVEVDSLEKVWEILTKANRSSDGVDDAQRERQLRQRHTELDAEHDRADRELFALEAELTVLKQRTDPRLVLRIAELIAEIAIKKTEREKIRIQRDAIQKSMLQGACCTNPRKMRQQLDEQQAEWEKLGARLSQLRAGGISQVTIRKEVTVTPLETRAERMTAVGVPTAIAFACGFVLATGFSYVLRRRAA